MYIWKTTQEERNIIENTMAGIVRNIEISQNFICAMWEEHFACEEDMKRAPLDEIGDMLYCVGDLLFNALLEYHLIIGGNFRGVEPFMEGVKRAEMAHQVQKAHSKAWETILRFPENEQAQKREALKAIMSMPDEQAAPLLEKLISSK